MRKLYTTSVFLLVFGFFSNFSSYGQVVAADDYLFGYGCIGGQIGNLLQDSGNGADTINGVNAVAGTSGNVVITILDNPYGGYIFIDENTGNVYLMFAGPATQSTITYEICDATNPNNCDIAYCTITSFPAFLSILDDNFSSNPIDNSTGGIAGNVLSNDSICGYPVTTSDVYVTPNTATSGISIDTDGIVYVPAGTAPGSYVLYYNACEIMNPNNCGNAVVIVLVTGSSNIVANYDDFSASNYPNTTTASVLNNDTLNGNSVTASQVTITPLNVPSGFTINTNGTISIGNVSEGTYFVPYQICDNANLTSCYVNYAYVVVFKNRILGKVKFDDENNGCDTGDAYLNNIKVKNVNGSITYTSYTQSYSGGQYYLIGDVGTNTVSVELPSYFTVSPATQVFNFTTPGTTTAPDFCVTANSAVNDLEIVLIPTRNVVPGLPVVYTIWYKNNGSTTLSGQITMQFDNTKMSFLSSSPSPNSTTANTITFNYTNLAPFQSGVIMNTKFSVFTPPAVDLGTVATFTGSITPLAGDATPTNNTNTVSQIAVNSQDPNDITVHEGSSVTLAQAQQNYLHYTVRFQNVGTSDAINIKVLSDLDPKLDWTTFELLTTSHNCRVKNNNGHLEFLFENINLPGTANEPLSHGYITFKVKPITSIAVGNVISSSANIYFDYNAPIATNTVSTTVGPNLNSDTFALNNLKYYPNPVKNILTLSNTSTIDSIDVTSLLGQKIITQTFNDLQAEINLSSLSNGVYFVKVRSEGQEKTIKIIKK